MQRVVCSAATAQAAPSLAFAHDKDCREAVDDCGQGWETTRWVSLPLFATPRWGLKWESRPYKYKARESDRDWMTPGLPIKKSCFYPSITLVSVAISAGSLFRDPTMVRQVSVTKQILTTNQIVEPSFAHLLEKAFRGSLPRELPIVNLDHN